MATGDNNFGDSRLTQVGSDGNAGGRRLTGFSRGDKPTRRKPRENGFCCPKTGSGGGSSPRLALTFYGLGLQHVRMETTIAANHGLGFDGSKGFRLDVTTGGAFGVERQFGLHRTTP